jgi:hypothetical protein
MPIYESAKRARGGGIRAVILPFTPDLKRESHEGLIETAGQLMSRIKKSKKLKTYDVVNGLVYLPIIPKVFDQQNKPQKQDLAFYAPYLINADKENVFYLCAHSDGTTIGSRDVEKKYDCDAKGLAKRFVQAFGNQGADYNSKLHFDVKLAFCNSGTELGGSTSFAEKFSEYMYKAGFINVKVYGYQGFIAEVGGRAYISNKRPRGGEDSGSGEEESSVGSMRLDRASTRRVEFTPLHAADTIRAKSEAKTQRTLYSSLKAAAKMFYEAEKPPDKENRPQ